MIDFSQFKTAHRIIKFETDEIESEVRRCVIGGYKNIQIDGKTTYTPQAGDKLFFLSGCNIPRTKVRDHCKVVGSAIVKSHADKATAIFFGPDTITGVLSQFSGWTVPKSGYIRWLQTAANLCYPSRAIIEAELEKVMATEHDFVFVDTAYSYVVNGHKIPFKNDDNEPYEIEINLKDTRRPTHKIVSTLRDETDRKYDIELLNSPLLYTQESLLKHLNSMIITKGMSNELGSMLQSKQQDDVIMGMEIMANSDYEKSLPYLIGLFKRNSWSMSRCKVWDHVNFGALKDYMGVTDWSNFTLEKSKDLLIKKGQGTRENMLLLVEIMTGYKEGDEPNEDEELKQAEEADDKYDDEDDDKQYEQSIREEEQDITASEQDES